MSSSLDSPDLSSPAQIVSHGHEKPANQHAASNIIYDDSGDKEIQSRVRLVFLPLATPAQHWCVI